MVTVMRSVLRVLAGIAEYYHLSKDPSVAENYIQPFGLIYVDVFVLFFFIRLYDNS